MTIKPQMVIFQEPTSCHNIFRLFEYRKHANIKFTCELEENNRISFLDVLVHKLDGSFSTDLYRKQLSLD